MPRFLIKFRPVQLNVGSVAEAQELLDNLSLAKEKLMQFDLIPLGPLSPLGLLLK